MKNKKEKIEDMLILIIAIIVAVLIFKIPWRKPTTWEYHEYIEEGHTWAEWCEYIKGGVDNE